MWSKNWVSHLTPSLLWAAYTAFQTFHWLVTHLPTLLWFSAHIQYIIIKVIISQLRYQGVLKSGFFKLTVAHTISGFWWSCHLQDDVPIHAIRSTFSVQTLMLMKYRSKQIWNLVTLVISEFVMLFNSLFLHTYLSYLSMSN